MDSQALLQKLLAQAVLRVNVAAILTGAGIIGVFSGLSAQNTAKDLLAGTSILFEKPYRVGETNVDFLTDYRLATA